MPALLCATMASPMMAEVVSCDLSGVPVRFEIDRTQFAPAINQNEPTQRCATTVQMGNAAFPAEPIIMGDVRGFWAEGMGGSDVMMVMQSDGSAVYADTRAGERLTGTCEVLQ
ncbi:hypothetical protein [Roseobacter sp. CCS2]|uniref:hypothetical protein n=1 Tax=Roseobacter sp. CCS2 TaxID=391593 RepID=UPI0012EA14F0|nr:hypothetical protein [Roseobacter sp. CCS2]